MPVAPAALEKLLLRRELASAHPRAGAGPTIATLRLNRPPNPQRFGHQQKQQPQCHPPTFLSQQNRALPHLPACSAPPQTHDFEPHDVKLPTCRLERSIASVSSISSILSSQDEGTTTEQQRAHPKASQPDVQVGGHGLLSYLSAADIRAKINEFNATATDEQLELLDEVGDDKSFKGYIRVTLNLTRPIRVSRGDLSISISPENTDTTGSPEASLPSPGIGPSRFFRTGSGGGSGPYTPSSAAFDADTSFFLPKEVSKGLHVTSATTSQEVISILLRKFKVVSNPRKFALYEMNLLTGEKRRLRRFEEPLALKLLWGGKNRDLILSLEEYNKDQHFRWEEFTDTELHNFLRILEEEEQAAVCVVTASYDKRRAELQRQISIGSYPKIDFIHSQPTIVNLRRVISSMACPILRLRRNLITSP
ncbi:uncharacterized protein MONBRDRAFT_28221 [Monosiga brevicollis MX1]|uniref:Ras-associating domain-containing protein n=1 Tax=Monosiga brevicollis TaxID=81824 RepID=A9V7J7_MONBE|nr:uncharacterized protein MONBRDRAFT_28221 [Monosiga brevicollis MX1]EDQ86528.1 predicted protein [Monosiga brevicollis MX1]|eukprot:XP_001748641.1 hypothetical protein [Monosiga brevicollis MX1]